MLDEKGESVSKRKLLKKLCDMCGDVFCAASNAAMYCPDCAAYRRRCRCGKSAIRTRTKLTGNMAAIERVNREAEAQGLSYGKSVGKQYAAKHVRIERKEREK